MRTLILAFALFLSGCATLEKVAGSTDTFIACKAADVITTKIALNSGLFHETNPFLKTLIGPHNFVPLIAFSVGAYLLLKYVNEPKLTMAANLVTCGIAGRNTYLLHGAGVIR